LYSGAEIEWEGTCDSVQPYPGLEPQQEKKFAKRTAAKVGLVGHRKAKSIQSKIGLAAEQAGLKAVLESNVASKRQLEPGCVCPAIYRPVCAVKDGQVREYGNSCAAECTYVRYTVLKFIHAL